MVRKRDKRSIPQFLIVTTVEVQDRDSFHFNLIIVTAEGRRGLFVKVINEDLIKRIGLETENYHPALLHGSVVMLSPREQGSGQFAPLAAAAFRVYRDYFLPSPYK